MTAPVVPSSHQDLLATQTAMLATIGLDGLPQVTAVAFMWDNKDRLFKISLNDSRQKARNLRRNPAATLFILDPDNRYRTLEIRAHAEMLSDEDFSFAAIAGAKYGKDFHDIDQPGETRSMVFFHPLRIVATDLSR